MSKYRNRDGGNPFDTGITPEEADNAIFSGGNVEGLVSNRVVAKATPLTSIWADVRQPRRAIPASIRLHWNGSPEEVPQLLNAWGTVVRQSINIDERQIIRGNGEGIDLDGQPSIVESYVSLLRLASDIKHVGLMNPITVVKQGQRHLIESGERRYLAHHLLVMWDDAEKWNKVPAIVSDGVDFVWRQATENTARRSLNAIGMARQLGLLIMDAREGMDGVKYNTYEDLVLSGGCDRRFYAQVANGNVHGIPRGMGERIEAAMGISMNQIRQYRALLKLTGNETLNDVLWVRADVEDWAEGAMRFIKEAIYGTQTKPSVISIDEVMQIVSRDEWSLNDIQNEIKQRRAALETDDSVTAVTVTSALPDEQTLIQQRREREREERIDQARQKIRERDWQREHEDRQYRDDDDLTYGDEDEGDEYLDNEYYMPNWERGTLVIFDEACAEWKSQRGFYRPNHAYVIPAGTRAKIKQLFNQRTKKGQHSLARIAVGAYEHVVPVQALALDEDTPTETDTRTADDHIAALTGDEVKQRMASDNGHSATSTQGGVQVFCDSTYGNKDLIDALFNLLSLVDQDAAEAVRDLHNVTMGTIERWHQNGVMKKEFDEIYDAIGDGLRKMHEEHIGVMMARVEELVKGGADA